MHLSSRDCDKWLIMTDYKGVVLLYREMSRREKDEGSEKLA